MEHINSTKHAVYAIKFSDDAALYFICVFIQLIAIGFALTVPQFANTILVAGCVITCRLMSATVTKYCLSLKKKGEYPYLLSILVTLFWLLLFPFLLILYYLKTKVRL